MNRTQSLVSLVALGVSLVATACTPASTSSSTSTSAAVSPPAAQAQAQAPLICQAKIARQWRGKTTNAKADEYAAYLSDAIKKFRTIKGNLGYQMMRETVGAETHFSVISYWESREAIKAYAGEDISRTRVAPRDPEFIIDPEMTVKNYDLAGADIGCK
ncbi:antibiotic biosynthesis monooxygenase [Pendulispora brunnea]|uniref:Antibiotic biosynthesis monooxygenase n=1 Tax=Pendulispora brunnea TaxID=2905690 RepID=A0ABZ2K1T2_9BACT